MVRTDRVHSQTIHDLGFLAGHLCLDFANTVDWRDSERPVDVLVDAAALVTFGERVGLYDRAAARAALAGGNATVGARELRRAKALREALHDIFSAVARDEEPDRAQLTLLRDDQAAAIGASSFVLRSGRWQADWPERDIRSVRFAVAISAAELLGDAEALSRVRRCPGRGCGWLFLDRTKNASRRWCSMATCGSREKMRRAYRRQAPTRRSP